VGGVFDSSSSFKKNRVPTNESQLKSKQYLKRIVE